MDAISPPAVAKFKSSLPSIEEIEAELSTAGPKRRRVNRPGKRRR